MNNEASNFLFFFKKKSKGLGYHHYYQNLCGETAYWQDY